MTTPGKLTVRRLAARAVNVPLRLPLVTGGGSVGAAPLCLVDLETEEGITGRSYLFCYTPLALKPVWELLANLDPVLRGLSAAPLELGRLLQARFRLLGAKGIVGMVLAGIDMAAWDALAKAADRPLARVLGGEAPDIPAYNSCGLGLIGADAAPAEAEALVAAGFSAIKVRLGYPSVDADIAVVRAVRAAVGDSIHLMSDYNQGLSVPEAEHRVRALADEGLYWIEEPCAADDYPGHARVRERSRCPIQMGENWWGPGEMAASLAAGASDLGMPDAMKIGGVSGWLQAAALAQSAGMPISSHLFPEISVHLMAATPTRQWLEYVDWAAPILAEPMEIRDGMAAVPETPGAGIAWNEQAVARFLVE